MATVIDASVMGAQLLPDEVYCDYARTILEQLDTTERITPIIFWYEIRNVLLNARRHNRIEQRHFDACLIQLTDGFFIVRGHRTQRSRGSGNRAKTQPDHIRCQLSRNRDPAQSQFGDVRPEARKRCIQRGNRESGGGIGGGKCGMITDQCK